METKQTIQDLFCFLNRNDILERFVVVIFPTLRLTFCKNGGRRKCKPKIWNQVCFSYWRGNTV